MSKKKLKIAVIGLGNIGQAFVYRLQRMVNDGLQAEKEFNFELVGTCDNNLKKRIKDDEISFSENYETWTSSSKVDIIVECVGGVSQASKIISEALNNGKHVITINGALMASEGERLSRSAQSKNLQLLFNGAVGTACIDNIESLNNRNKVTKIYGVLNSTSNYILNRMRENNVDAEKAIRDAIELKFADNNPDMDISGKDTLHKLALLSSVAFGKWFDLRNNWATDIRKVTPQDSRLAAKFGYRILPLGVATAEEIKVSPCLVDEASIFGTLQGDFTGVTIESQNHDDMFIANRGGSREAIVGAMVNDLFTIYNSRGIQKSGFAKNSDSALSGKVIKSGQGQSGNIIQEMPYYVRINSMLRERFKEIPNITVTDELQDDDYTGLLVTSKLPANELHGILEGKGYFVLNIL